MDLDLDLDLGFAIAGMEDPATLMMAWLILKVVL